MSGLENGSLANITATTAPPPASDPLWSVVLNVCGAVAGIIGLIANVAAFIIIGRLAKSLSRSSRLILRHQAVLDGVLCLISTINLLQPAGMPATGNSALDYFLCHFWWGQTINWTMIGLSIWNLVIFAIDRFIAIVYPFMYRSMSLRKFVFLLIGAYILSLLVFIAGVFQVSLKNGQCGYTKLMSTHHMANFYKVYVYLWLFMAYLLPVCGFFFLYGWIVMALRKSRNFQKKTSDDRSDTVERALLEVTRTGIVVTSFFIVAMSFDTFYYFLDQVTDTVIYKPHTPFQRFATTMISLNMIVNPFIYVIFMPVYRRTLKSAISSVGSSIRQRTGKSTIMTSTTSTSDASSRKYSAKTEASSHM